jgi:hypothetical protein
LAPTGRKSFAFFCNKYAVLTSIMEENVLVLWMAGV